MKRYIKLATESKEVEPKRQSTKNVKIVCNAMGWPLPFHYFKTANGHRCRWLDDHNFIDVFVYEEAIKVLCNRFDIDFNSLEPRRSTILDPYGWFWAFCDKRAEQLGMSWREYLNTPEFDKLNKEFYFDLCNDPEVVSKGKIDTEEALDEIYDVTGINCFLSKGGFLVVPFAD